VARCGRFLKAQNLGNSEISILKSSPLLQELMICPYALDLIVAELRLLGKI
jgi:hypothetical protein